MSTFTAQPVDMISVPNYYAQINNGWTLVSPNQTTLWFLLEINDSLGIRPYFAAPLSLLQLTFQRQDLLSINVTSPSLTQTVQTITKTATVNAQNPSLWNITLLSQDIQNIRSGTILFSLTESSIQTQWAQPWMVARKLTDPGY